MASRGELAVADELERNARIREDAGSGACFLNTRLPAIYRYSICVSRFSPTRSRSVPTKPSGANHTGSQRVALQALRIRVPECCSSVRQVFAKFRTTSRGKARFCVGATIINEEPAK
jgi:hypothetical protein